MRRSKKDRNNWRGITPYIGGREWLRALGIAALMAMAAFGAVILAPGRDSLSADLPVVINRVMTSNPSACYSVDGEYYDWIELMNVSGGAVNLSGWRLTNAGDLRGAWTFGDRTLAPGEALLVYCHELPEGYAGDALFTGFRLSSDGEVLMLADARQQVSTLAVPQLAKAHVYRREASTGAYSEAPFAEALAADDRYAGTLTPEFNPDGLMISEIMPINRSTLADEDGDYSDWIELYNATGSPVSLEGCVLSDDDADQQKWRLPAREMQPGEYLVVFASGKDRRSASGEPHASFRLSGNGESLRLYNPSGEVISYVEYADAQADVALARDGDGRIVPTDEPSPGQPNTEAGARAFAEVMWENDLGLYINEVLATGKGSDWLELMNTSGRRIDLSGMGLSDDPARPRKWQFPDGASIEAGGFVVVALSPTADAEKAQADSAAGTALHADYTAPFALSDRETACLSMPDGRLIDRVKLFDQHRDISYGRVNGSQRHRYLTTPTPGAANDGPSYARVAGGIRFSTPPGIVRASHIDLEMTADPGMDIYYTTDGSTPTPKSRRYDGPIPLDSNTCIRAVAWRGDALPSEVVTASFIFGQHTLRLVSVTGNTAELIGSNGTLNTGARKSGCSVHVEIYEPDGTKLVGQGCHLILSGHQSRVKFAQKSFRLTARSEYGDNRFRAALFTKRDYTEYKSIVLRAGGQDVFQTKMRDSILTSLAADTRLFYQETEPCVVYVNGKYWGVYNLRERVDEHAICQFEGWEDPDGVLLGEGGGSKRYKEMLSWVAAHDLTRSENLEELRRIVDVENYLDYVALEMYTCNQDLNNIRYYCSPNEDPRWKWVLFDLDLSYQIDRNNVEDWLSGGQVGTITSQDATLFVKLMKNADMRDYFLTRMGQLLSTTLSAERVVERIEARYRLLSPEMEANCERWSWKLTTWNQYVKRMVKYAQERPAKLAGYLAESFRLNDAQVQQYFGDVK